MELFVEHLTVIDSAYLHAEHGIVGESWIVDVALLGDLDPQSMVMDFAHVKKQLKAALDNSLDHTLIVPAQSPNLKIIEGESLTLDFTFGNGETLQHVSPKEAVTLVPMAEIRNDLLQQWVQQKLMAVVPSNVTNVEVTLRHEDETPPHYHYAHGLKKHDGNCQRIAHGHRSRIAVWENGTRSEKLEKHIAQQWAHAYLVTNSDVTGNEGANTVLAYTSAQGRFRLSYPTARCHFMETDSTIECIAAHLAGMLKMQSPANSYKVRAYEGVHKGASAEA